MIVYLLVSSDKGVELERCQARHKSMVRAREEGMVPKNIDNGHADN